MKLCHAATLCIAEQLASVCDELRLSCSFAQDVKECAVPKCVSCSPGNPYKCLICQKSFEVALDTGGCGALSPCAPLHTCHRIVPLMPQ